MPALPNGDRSDPPGVLPPRRIGSEYCNNENAAGLWVVSLGTGSPQVNDYWRQNTVTNTGNVSYFSFNFKENSPESLMKFHYEECWLSSFACNLNHLPRALRPEGHFWIQRRSCLRAMVQQVLRPVLTRKKPGSTKCRASGISWNASHKPSVKRWRIKSGLSSLSPRSVSINASVSLESSSSKVIRGMPDSAARIQEVQGLRPDQVR